MKKIIAIAALAATTAFTAAPASAQISGFKNLGPATTTDTMIHKTGRRGGRIAGAIALGLIGAAVIAGNARATHYDPGDPYDRYDGRCTRWRRWCRNGEDRACWKYDNRC